MADNGKRKSGEEDLISTLSDVILQDILCFVPTKFAIRTSTLSKRWRHVWCGIPSLSLGADKDKVKAASINETLTRYSAPKIKNFHVKTSLKRYIPHMDEWIKFAMSRNVENLSLDLDFWSSFFDKYEFPDFFYINPSIKQITLKLSDANTMIPRSFVSWTSLKTLSLSGCTLSDESMTKILSGCPILESLALYLCNELTVVDLSKSPRLRTLQVCRILGLTQIVAPHIHCLMLKNCGLPCVLVDVSSLTEAKLNIFGSYVVTTEQAGLLQVVVLKMLEKLQNAEKLTLGGKFLQILSIAELCGVPFPMLKVKYLTLKAEISPYVIPGIERVLQNSPCLKKLIVRAKNRNTIPEKHLDNYLKSQGFNMDECWISKDGVVWNKSPWNLELKHMISLVELMLKNTKKAAKMVVLLDERRYLRFTVKKLVQRLSHYNNVVIVLKPKTKPKTDEEW